MKKLFLLLIMLQGLGLVAQQTISGTFTPAEDYKFLLIYQLQSGSKNYITNASITNGTFSLSLPENSQPGMYRLVYAIPQDEFYIDVIYNGKEDVNFTFNSGTGVSFSNSQENIIMNSYFQTMSELVGKLLNYYIERKTDASEFAKHTKELREVQNTYEERSKGLLVHHFIAANRPYIPSKNETVEQYVANKKEHYFDHLTLDNKILQSSDFLVSKLSNYVFTALPLKQMTSAERQTAIEENIKTVHQKIKNVPESFQFEVYYKIWKMSNEGGMNSTAQFVYKDYLEKLPIESLDPEKARQLVLEQRLGIGAIAPDIEWNSGNAQKKLSSLNSAETYILAFWSSTCGHCLQELPRLHQTLKDYGKVKVIAVGLEEDKTTWKTESDKLPDFEHAIALGKWDSEYAETYAIEKTPTYFVLDSEKRIIFKPEDLKELIKSLK
ncbi:TlpA disulfide reductase family protein [Cytophaga sp. FL35]|uniref:TlpA disulfide reductase family protein n=1 Tax=Cytophaga sp. FL35 TaxID=1904456 RepID=UPI0016536B17|nr:TlpA disulfide reductase family protein [Cytophaga sp. FL35]MBC6999335.1 AhpC/TSA family protein [Cytophaga sp. FL35]